MMSDKPEGDPDSPMIKEEHSQKSANDKKLPDSEKIWHEIGFVRPLGGFLYNLVLVVGGAVFGIFFTVWFLPNIVYPFPDAMGYESIVKSLFSFYFAIADVGLGTAIQRFIGEENIKNPKKTIQYLQFFIYFQMFTGALQITILSIWVFTAATESELAYATWFFLLYSTIQWPGMLGIFQGTLQAYQRYDRANVVSFIQALLLENTTRVVCILIGRWWGINNPMVGEMMGATIGSIIGAYLDDFIAAMISARWCMPILREIDPSYGLSQIFRVDFDLPFVKKCLWYGLKVMLQGIIFPGANMLAVLVLVRYLPSYPTLWGIYLIAETITVVVGAFSFEFTSSFAESYLNKKYKLAADYMSRIYIWSTLIGFMMCGLLFVGAPLIGIIAGTKYALAVPLIQVFIWFEIMEVIIKAHDKVFRGGNKPEYNILVLIIEQSARIGFLYLFLVPFPLGAMSIVLSRGLGWVIKWFVSYFLIQKTMLKFKINLWQTIFAPLVATFFEIIWISVLKLVLLGPITSLVSEVIGAIIIIAIGLLTGPLLIWLPIYSLMGGWDVSMIDVLEKAYQISGPSKPIVRTILKISKRFSAKSPFYGKYPLNIEGLDKEIKELIELRNSNF